MQAYIECIRSLVDALTTVEEKLTQPETVLTVIGGLGPEYSSFMSSLTTRFDHNKTFVDL